MGVSSAQQAKAPYQDLPHAQIVLMEPTAPRECSSVPHAQQVGRVLVLARPTRQRDAKTAQPAHTLDPVRDSARSVHQAKQAGAKHEKPKQRAASPAEMERSLFQARPHALHALLGRKAQVLVNHLKMKDVQHVQMESMPIPALHNVTTALLGRKEREKASTVSNMAAKSVSMANMRSLVPRLVSHVQQVKVALAMSRHRKFMAARSVKMERLQVIRLLSATSAQQGRKARAF